MAQLISIIGVSGAGKTSLVRALAQQKEFALGLEDHAARPFQSLFKQDSRHAFANQFDFLLFRAEQERLLRLDPRPALTDGGLDLDFHGFTRLFHTRGWLNDPELELLRRYYTWTRELLPPPDLIIHLTISDEVVRSRLSARERINIASADDAALLASFLDDWLAAVPSERLLRLDVTREPDDYRNVIPIIFDRIEP